MACLFSPPRAPFSARRRPRGFTLIEVIIVVAIAAILAAVALPSYQQYIRRGQLQEGFSQMSGFLLQMEQYYQDNRSYKSGDACPSGLTGKLSSKYFTFSCSADASSYTLTATGKGNAAGYDYTIDQANTRKTTKFAGRTQSGLNCWAESAASC